jgi:hypothetical protein
MHGLGFAYSPEPCMLNHSVGIIAEYITAETARDITRIFLQEDLFQQVNPI